MQSLALLTDLSLIKPLGKVNLHQSKCPLCPRAFFAGLGLQTPFNANSTRSVTQEMQKNVFAVGMAKEESD